MNPKDVESFATTVANNPTIKSLRENIATLTTEKDELLDQIQNVEDDVTSDL